MARFWFGAGAIRLLLLQVIVLNLNLVKAQEFIESSEIIDGKLIRAYSFQRSSNKNVESDVFTATIPLLPGEIPKLRCILDYDQAITVTGTAPNKFGGGITTRVGGSVSYQNFPDQQFIICNTENVKSYGPWENSTEVQTFPFFDSGTIEDNDEDNGRGVVVVESTAELRMEIYSSVINVSSGNTISNSANFTFTIELIYDVETDLYFPPIFNLYQSVLRSNEETGGNFDVVADKPFAIELRPIAESLPEDEEEVELFGIIESRSGGQEFFSIETVIPSVNFDQNLPTFVEVSGLAPGEYRATFFLDPDNKIEEIDNENNFLEFNINSLRTYPLNVGLIGVSCESGCYSPTPFFLELDALSDSTENYLKDMMPVREIDFSIDSLNGELVGSESIEVGGSLGDFRFDQGVLRDFQNLEVRSYVEGYRKVLGLVDRSYFSHHFPNNDGLVGLALRDSGSDIKAGKVGIASLSAQVVAHEIGHLLGADHYEGDELASQYVYGAKFYVEKSPLMLNGGGDDLTDFWIRKEAYSNMYLTLLNPEIDPPLIVVSGLLDKRTNTVLNLSVEKFPDGNLSSNAGGETFKVSTENSSGDTLASVDLSFNRSLFVDIESESGLDPVDIDLDIIPFVASLPDSEDISNISIAKGDLEILDIPVGLEDFISIIDEIEIEDFKYRFSFISKIKHCILQFKARRLDRAIKLGKRRKAKKLYKRLMFSVKKSRIEKNKKKSVLRRMEQLKKMLNF